jgi:hypothetical protein
MKRLVQTHLRWTEPRRLIGVCLTAASLLVSSTVALADQEYTGKLDPQLVVNRDDHEQVVFRPMRELSRIKISSRPTATRLSPPAASITRSATNPRSWPCW